MTFDTSIFVAKFVEEARDRIKTLSAALLRLEQTPGAMDAIAEALREAHSIKGSALMLGFTDISQISHQLEELFVAAKTKPALLDNDAFDIVFSAVDQVSSRIEGLARGQMDAVEVGDICAGLAALLDPARKRGRVQFSGDAAESSTSPVAATKRAELRQSLRVPIEKLDRLAHLAPEMVVHSLKSFERHSELRRLERVLSRLRDRVREARLMPETSPVDRGAELAEYADALDAITRRMREFLVNFSDDRVRLNLITEELRQNVIELTMLPVASVFDAFPRAVRDLARSFDKQIDLIIQGRETELDKKIIEQIAEPLVHLIRNAADHAIEAPADRERAGKPAAGRLILSAEQQGNRILIALKDDGRGIDVPKLRALAIERGVAPQSEIDDGHPTRCSASSFSRASARGRRPRTSRGGASAWMSSGASSSVSAARSACSRSLERGRPLRSIFRSRSLCCALCCSKQERNSSLSRRRQSAGSCSCRPPMSGSCSKGPVAEIDGETIPLTPLSSMLQVAAAPATTKQTVLVAEASEGRFGIVVEAVHEEQELVFKELKGPLRDQKTFTGAALLGNGDIVPILDVNALFELASRAPSPNLTPALERREAPRVCRVLVVDDSLVAGELQKNILLTAGYESDIASDGVEALDALRRENWDLVIADVDMPRMTGFELTTHIRADEQFRDIPVIIVTSRDTVDDRRRGFEAGADAYVLKREFDQTQLLETVRRLIGRAANA